MKKRIFSIIPLLMCAAARAETVVEAEAESGGIGFPIFIVIIIALIVAFIVLSCLKAQMKTAKHENLAMNYVRDGSFKLDVQQDLFLYQTETRQKVEKKD